MRHPHGRGGRGCLSARSKSRLQSTRRNLGRLADIPALWMNRNLHPGGLQLQTCPLQLNSLLWEQAVMQKVCWDAVNKHPAPCSSPSASSQAVRSLGGEPLQLPSAWCLHLHPPEHRNASGLGQRSGLHILTAGSPFCSLKPSKNENHLKCRYKGLLFSHEMYLPSI